MSNSKHRLFVAFILLCLASFCGGSASSGESSSGDDAADTGSATTETSLALRLPYSPGSEYLMSQGFGGAFSHSDDCGYYSLDFIMDEGTSILAAASGRVVRVKEDSNTGGGTRDFEDDANYVYIDYGNGRYGSYLHLCQNCVDVAVGDDVTQGQVIGRSGNTGFSTEPHLHFAILSWETDCSVTFGFEDVNDENGIPVEGENYTSQNDGSSSGSYIASLIPADRFSTNGVTLDEDLPWSMHASDTITVSGTLDDGLTTAFLFIFDGQGNTLDMVTASADGDQNFSISYHPSIAAGSYYLALTGSATNSGYSEFSVHFLIQ